MLEKMSDFFEARLDGYDEHMMTNIESANEFYPLQQSNCQPLKTAKCLIWAVARDWNCKNTIRLTHRQRLQASTCHKEC